LQAEVLDDAFDAPGADRQTGLAQFLGDDFGRGLGIEEAVADDLADDFIGAAVVAFGSGRLVDEGRDALLGKALTQLEVTLLAVVEGRRRLKRPKPEALPGDEHGEFAGSHVLGGDCKEPGRTDQPRLLRVEVKHGGTWGPEEEEGGSKEEDSPGVARSPRKDGGKNQG
jgi:hypothetical protein